MFINIYKQYKYVTYEISATFILTNSYLKMNVVSKLFLSRTKMKTNIDLNK